MKVQQFKNGIIFNHDCLKVMDYLISQNIKVDAIITDLPYGTTKNRWDNIIPFDEMWNRIWKINKDNGAVCLFCDGLFMANLMLSDKNWKYNRIWNKELPSGFLNANKMPLRVTEEIAIFYKKQPTYNPQKVKGKPSHSKGKVKENKNNNYGDFNFVDNSEKLGDMKHPTSLISIQKPHPSKSIHPTQKPIDLLEELIKTYTNENEVVLDFTCGSASTCVACQNTNRKFIGIELNEEYYNISIDRLLKNEGALNNEN